MIPKVPCLVGTGRGRHVLTETEHFLAAHFDHCGGEGHCIARHNAVCEVYGRMLSSLGYSVLIKEIPIGAVGGGKNQKIDGIARNWTAGSATAIGFDGCVGAALIHSRVVDAARTDYFVTRALEKEKRRKKAPGCEAKRLSFLPVAMDNFSGLGEKARDVVLKGYQARRQAAKTDGEKWAISLEFTSYLAMLSAAVQKGNAAAFFGLAHPLAGGPAGPAPVPLDVDGADRGHAD